MNLCDYYIKEGELPLDVIKSDGGFVSIFRTIACIGDSLSSGEFESHNKDGETCYNDIYEYSWGQYMARVIGSRVYNFSKGGMSARKYMLEFADSRDFFSEDKLCQAYFLALGVNDVLNQNQPIGSLDDIDFEDYTNNKDSFAGWYARIIQRIKSMRPDAKFFLITIPRDWRGKDDKKEAHANLLYDLAAKFDNCFVIDLFKYAPTFDQEFDRNFRLGGHLNPMGYKLFADIIMSYTDYIIRKDPESFYQTGFIGTGKKY